MKLSRFGRYLLGTYLAFACWIDTGHADQCSHKPVGILNVSKGSIADFCVDQKGNIRIVVPNPRDDSESELRIYSVHGLPYLPRDIEVVPTAIANDPKGSGAFYGGKGRILKSSTTGCHVADSPTMPLRKEITSIAASDEEVFVCCPDGDQGYAIWRMDHKLQAPKKIIAKLKASDGQLNIATHENNLWIARTDEHKVECYDREGKKLKEISDCGRPNCICFAGSFLLTTESGSPVVVKKWSLDGEFLGVACTTTFGSTGFRIPIHAHANGEIIHVMDVNGHKIHSFFDRRFEPTHVQVGTIRPADFGSSKNTNVEGLLASFCIDQKDRIITLCGGIQEIMVDHERGGYKTKLVRHPPEIRVLNMDGKLVDTWPLSVSPRSVGIGPGNRVYVGTKTGLIVYDSEGEVLATYRSPSDESRLPTRKMAEAIAKRVKAEAAIALKHTKRNKKGKKNPPLPPTEEEIERTRVTKDEIDEQFMILTAAASKDTEITGVAVTEKDIFIAHRKNYSFDIVRLTHDLKNPKTIATRLRGCCGQMDIQPDGQGGIYVAENSRFNVVHLDRDGNELARWGYKDRHSVLGFGSCCNPMTVRVDTDGNVYTAESNLGRVKKYSPQGEFLGHIGSAVIQGGCKHVAIDFSRDGSRLYVLDITNAEIAVLKAKD